MGLLKKEMRIKKEGNSIFPKEQQGLLRNPCVVESGESHRHFLARV
jgi:hypothetical protein